MKEEIRKGDTTSFLFKGQMIPVQVKEIGIEKLKCISLDLNYEFSITKDMWKQQVKLIEKSNNTK